MAAKLVEDAAEMAAHVATRPLVHRGADTRAQREDVAQETRFHPLVDLLEASVIAEHIAHLDGQPLLLGRGDCALPLGPVVTRRFVIPDMLAREDTALGLVQPVDVLVGAVSRGHGAAPLFIGLKNPCQFNIGTVDNGTQLAGRVGVFGSVLGYTNWCHFWLLGW